jgi:peptidoglycan L-alanyl-D-glutamate endopeptidase CwlK
MASRDVKDLHPELAKRWTQAKDRYAAKFPDLPQPFLTQTYRSSEEQAASYAQGRTTPGKIVTNAKPGQSLHNYHPALAFDIAFKKDRQVYWTIDLFKKFAATARWFGLEWGGDWKTFQDNPHFQVPNYTWQMAKDGVEPHFEDNVG